jgi:hypothetical protein
MIAWANRSNWSSTGKMWASSRAQEGLGERKKLFTMLVQAQCGESQAARDFWEVPGKKMLKFAAGSQRGAAQAADEPPA